MAVGRAVLGAQRRHSGQIDGTSLSTLTDQEAEFFIEFLLFFWNTALLLTCIC